MSDAHIIIAGQSNALGYLNTGPAPYVATARVQIWADTDGDGVGDAWNFMRPGANTGTRANPGVWGPEVEEANRWLSTHATGTLWIDKIAQGSTGLAQDPGQLDWSPHSSGEMFDRATASVHAAQANLVGTPYAFSHWDALDWMQGETDATDPEKAAAYGANLTDFVDHVRTEWAVDQVVVARITDTAGAYNLQVREAEWAADQADAHLVSFKTIGFEMQADHLHYDAAGQLALGGAFFDATVFP